MGSAASSSSSQPKGNGKGDWTEILAAASRPASLLAADNGMEVDQEGEGDKPKSSPIVTCDACGETKEKWSNMVSEWSDEKDGYSYKCWVCVKKEQNLDTEGEARMFVLKSSRAFAKKEVLSLIHI